MSVVKYNSRDIYLMKLRHIIYGDYTQNSWHPLRGIRDPKTIEFIDNIKELNWDDYRLFLYGGILVDNYTTYDIDGTILGPRDPERIKYLLDNITRIGFSIGVYPDIKWSEDLYDPTRDGTKNINYAHYRGYKFIDDRFYRFASLNNGLYERDRTWPLMKSQNNGLVYKSPIQII